jgi:hypothetical protein
LIVLTYAIVAAYTFSSFPFDNACLTGEAVPDTYIGKTYNVDVGENAGTSFTISKDKDSVYRYCEQNLFSEGYSAFPPIPSHDQWSYEWMNSTQAAYASIYGRTMIGVIWLVVISILSRLFIRIVLPFFIDTYTVSLHVNINSKI